MPSASAASRRESRNRGTSRVRAALAIDRVVAAERRKRTGNSVVALIAGWRRTAAPHEHKRQHRPLVLSLLIRLSPIGPIYLLRGELQSRLDPRIQSDDALT